MIMSNIKDIKKTIKPTKDNSVKTDYFVNCRCCKELITADFRSKLDKRYCLDCL